MRKNEKSAFYQYIYNQRCQLDLEVMNLQQALRYRKVDTIDCHELALTIERRNAFYQFSQDLMELLKLYELDELDKRGEGEPHWGTPRPNKNKNKMEDI